MGSEWIQLAHTNVHIILLSSVLLLLLTPISECGTIQNGEIIKNSTQQTENVTNPIAIESTIKTVVNNTITSSPPTTTNVTTVNPIASTTIVAQSQSPVIELPELNTTTTTTPRVQMFSNETTIGTNASLTNSKLHELNKNNESTTLGAGDDDTTIVPITTDLSHTNVDNDITNTTPIQQQKAANIDEDDAGPFLTTATVPVASEDYQFDLDRYVS